MGKKRSRMTKKSDGLIANDRRYILAPDSDFFIREAYKTLRTNTMFSLAEKDGCKVMMVTSSQQGEGKSINALNLAISFAEGESRVLLIDCDLRRPKLARLVQKSAKSGLSNVLLKPSLLPESLIHTEWKNLDVLLSGDVPPNPSELLGSAKMSSLLQELQKQYDYILLDTPPVGVVTDGVLLAAKCDGVLFVVRANKTERGMVSKAVSQLEYVHAKILGFVLDDVGTVGRGGYGYKKYKQYGYGYSSEP